MVKGLPERKRLAAASLWNFDVIDNGVFAEQYIYNQKKIP